MKESRLSIRMSDTELEQLKDYATKNNRTLADWVRETLLTSAGIQTDKIQELEKRLALLESKIA